MNIILILTSENFSIVAITISFLLGRKHNVYVAASFAARVTYLYY